MEKVRDAGHGVAVGGLRGPANRPVFLGRWVTETGARWLTEDEGLHRGRFMLLAGSGLRAGAQWRGNLQGSLSGPEVAAHRAVKADRPGRPGPAPHYCIT